ncbi:MAG: hypothetical protein U0441_10065 [Polyangiaceae bacterium]
MRLVQAALGRPAQWAKTFVRVGGPVDGPPLVLMHGAGTNIAGAGHDLAAVHPELVNQKVLAFLRAGRP